MMITHPTGIVLRITAALTVVVLLTGSPSLRSGAGLSPQPELAGTGPALHEPQVSPEQAIALAVNEVKATPDGYRLRHPRHTATFTSAGLRFVPRRGGPDWRWESTYVGSDATALAGIELGAVRPVQAGPQTVAYRRGAVVEQYLMREQGIEQQFVIPQPLALGGADLVIAGRVDSAGLFEATEEGWLWRTDEGVVSVGNVRVLDARGTEVPATMRVTATRMEIVVEGAALARAIYPVTIDPEIGANDFRISDMGGDVKFDASRPAVAYNGTDNEYLVVWRGDDNTGALVDNEFEIFGQRIDAATGAEVGTHDFRISDMGSDGGTQWEVHDPAVAYNSTDNEYLVVWEGNDHTAQLHDDELEIYGQRLDAATGAEVGVNDFRISDMGPDGDDDFDASDPSVAYNSSNNQYLVVWRGCDTICVGVLNAEYEIYGQRINAATGAAVGVNDFRISDMGPDGDASFDAGNPAVAYNGTDNQYLVVWEGDDDTAPLVDGETEIFGQRLDAATGGELGTNDFRISDMGLDGDASFDAGNPAVAYNSTDNQYLVVWQGCDTTCSGVLVPDEVEIYGQRLDGATGTEMGVNDFRISDMGLDGDADFDAVDPAVAYNSTDNEYLVVWQGCDTICDGLLSSENEIYGQRLDGATGAEVGANDFRISDMGPDGDVSFDAFRSAVAYNSTDNQYLVVWYGDDDTPPLVNSENEVFGQRLDGATGAEVGANDFRISDMGGGLGFLAALPAVAYNSTNNEYLVVWYGDDNTAPLVENETEIFGQRIDGATGAEVGANDFRISDMGPDGDTRFLALQPAVAYNTTDNEYLVVWHGCDTICELLNDEVEVYGQRLDGATGAEVGANDFRISDMGPDGDPRFVGGGAAVAYNSTDKEYLVVWGGDDDTGALVDDEFEIFGQRLDAGTGAEVGVNDFRISDMGPDGDVSFDAYVPAVVYNSTDNEYLVVWRGDDNTGALVDDEFEIFGQRVEAATGAEIGTDFRISDMGPDGDASFDVKGSAVAYNSTNNEYLVVWEGCDTICGGVDPGYEIYAQRLDAATGAEVGANDFRISDMGPEGDLRFGDHDPAVAYNSTNNQYLVVWWGDDNTPPLIYREDEIFGQRLDAGTGAEVGVNDFRISDMGPDGDARFHAFNPAVAYDGTDNEYLVVWWSEDDTPPLVDDEYEIFGQRLAQPMLCLDFDGDDLVSVVDVQIVAGAWREFFDGIEKVVTVVGIMEVVAAMGPCP